MKGDNISDDLPPVLYIGRTRYSFVIILLHQHLRVHLFPLKSVELVIVFFLIPFSCYSVVFIEMASHPPSSFIIIR